MPICRFCDIMQLNFRTAGFVGRLPEKKKERKNSMYCVKNIKNDLYWVGGTDRRLALFENVYPIPRGVSYNAYLILDEKTVLLDTVDYSVSQQLLKISPMC